MKRFGKLLAIALAGNTLTFASGCEPLDAVASPDEGGELVVASHMIPSLIRLRESLPPVWQKNWRRKVVGKLRRMCIPLVSWVRTKN